MSTTKIDIQVTEFAFTGYPVTNLRRARAFYEGVLGLTKSTAWLEGEDKGWVEYDVGGHTLAITNDSAQWKPSSDGPAIALEVADFDAAVAVLKDAGTPFVVEPYQSPVCRLAVVKDPDGTRWRSISADRGPMVEGGARSVANGTDESKPKPRTKGRFMMKEWDAKREKDALAARELRRIPGVGVSIAQDLLDLGVRSVGALKGRDPERLYKRFVKLRGQPVDRCMLYVLRCAVYFASEPAPEAEKLKWWNWKDVAGSRAAKRGATKGRVKK